MRSWKVSDSILCLGVYKKRGSQLSVDFTAGASGGDLGNDDVLGVLLNAALPGVDVSAEGISGKRARDLNKAIKDALNRSLSVQLNATCASPSSVPK